MIIEKKNTADLLTADYNPRKDLKPSDTEYEKLKRSIEQLGYVEPVIWNKTTGKVVGGHQRLKVLIDIGMTEVDCVVVELTEEKEKALNIALNKISGEWDKDKLALLIADLQGANFDISLTGFGSAEIDDLFKDTLKDGIKDDDFNVGAELEKPTFSKAGDVWTLGRHRLICGDSTKVETFDLIFTIDEIQSALGCRDKKATKLLDELERKYDLIERNRQGLGKPNLIYVKNFIGSDVERRFLNRQNHDVIILNLVILILFFLPMIVEWKMKEMTTTQHIISVFMSNSIWTI